MSVDDRLARLARRERWVVTSGEMVAEGLSRSAVDRRTGRVLFPLFHATYLYGRTAPTADERLRAALKATRGAVLAHRAAGDHWGVMRWRGDVELIAPTRRRRQAGLHVRTRVLDPRDVTWRRGLPVTTLARTYVDLAGILTLAELGRAVHEGDCRKLLRVPAIDAAIGRAGHFRGRANLLTVLAARRPVHGRLATGLERKFHGFLRDHGFPPARHNELFELDGEWASIDAVFPEHWLGVEVDGRDVHDTLEAFHRDRRRDRRMRAVHALPIVRITELDLDTRAAETAADLWASLRRGEGRRHVVPGERAQRAS